MTRHIAVAIATAALLLAGGIRPGFASQVCPSGHTAKPQCLRAIQKVLRTSQNLSECFQELDDEYNGLTGHGPGRKEHYQEIVDRCDRLLSRVYSQTYGRYSPNAVTSDVAVGSPEAAVLDAKNFFDKQKQKK
ncbi:MAG TPA: hypothetical protein VJ770_12030 [Stellaceae bacterium]|nr:hypothetical protein [Stellaceae bacterium]